MGYYEWRTAQGAKQPYFVHTAEDWGLMVFAGLWEQREGQYSCTILTRESAGTLAQLHGRMPVMLSPEDARCWLIEGPVWLTSLTHRRCISMSSFMRWTEPLAIHVARVRN